MFDRKIIESLTKDIFYFKGVLETSINEKNRIEKDLEKSNEWIGKQPTYLKFLQNLQNALHQKNLGAFSQLLTYLIKDVLGKDKDILFDLYTYRNLPALKIESSNDGFREDIVEGNGGSIANIVSTGLRLIVLSRLRNRKFIILDEPDCWLKPEHVPEFAKIIGQLSEKLKIQTVIISHHDFNFFKEYGRVISLEKNGNLLESNIIHDTKYDNIEHEIISSVRLRNFMSHTDTLFELHPYLTCIVGENDIGKSVLSTAFKSIVYGESSDSYIKHNTEESQVLISLSSEFNILWQRFRKINETNPQKVKYSLFQGNSLIASEFNSSNCPIFIDQVMNITKIEDLDVHIGNQKQPVFLLSSEVKPNDRAKILSLGKESILVQNMMESIKVKTKEHNQVIKESSKKLISYNKIENCLNNVEDIERKLESLSEREKDLENEIKKSDNLSYMINELSLQNDILATGNINLVHSVPNIKDISLLSKIVDDLNLTEKILKVEKSTICNFEPNITEIFGLDKVINRLKLSSSGSQIPHIFDVPEFQGMMDTKNLEEIINNLSFNGISSYDKIEVKNFIPETVELSGLDQLIFDIANTLNSISFLNKELDIYSNNIKDAENELSNYLVKNPLCPTCNQQISLTIMKECSH